MAKREKNQDQISTKVTPILDGKYEIVGRDLGKIAIQAGTFDLSDLTEAQAELLITRKAPWIRRAE